MQLTLYPLVLVASLLRVSPVSSIRNCLETTQPTPGPMASTLLLNDTSLIAAPSITGFNDLASTTLGLCSRPPPSLTLVEDVIIFTHTDGFDPFVVETATNVPAAVSIGLNPAANVSSRSTTASLDLCFAPPSPLIDQSFFSVRPELDITCPTKDGDPSHGELEGGVHWNTLASLAQRACLVVLFFFLTLHSRRLMKEMRSGLADATALESLSTAIVISISRLERQIGTQAEALSRFPSLIVILKDAMARLSGLQVTLEARAIGELDRKLCYLRNVIGFYDRNDCLEVDFNSLQSRMEERLSSAADSDVAADEEIVLLLERLAESQDRLEDAETKIQERVTAVKSLEIELGSVRSDCQSLTAGKDGLRKHLSYLHEVNRLEAEEHCAEASELQAHLAHLKASCDASSERTAIAMSKADALAKEIDRIFSASHCTQQALIGDIASASNEVSSLTADLAKQDAEYTKLSEAQKALQLSCAQLDDKAGSLESTLAQLEANEKSLRAASLKETSEHDERVAALKAERDAMDASHASALEGLARLKADADRVAQETLTLVASIREKQASNKRHFEDTAAALKQSIANNNTEIAERKAACIAQERDIKLKKATLATRQDVFKMMAEQWEASFDLARELNDTISYDRQQYESMLDEATNKAARARREQGEAEKLAEAARRNSDEVARETAVTKHAFATQLKDLEAAEAALLSSNAKLKDEIETLRQDNAVLGERVDALKKAHEDHKRPLSIRLRSAQADIERFNMREVDAVNRLNAQIAALGAQEEALNAKMAEYQCELVRVHEETERVERARREAGDKLTGAREAFRDLMHQPSSGVVFVTGYSSSRVSSEGGSLSSPECTISCSAIFDASFEEALEGDVVESKTCKGLAEAELGLGVLL